MNRIHVICALATLAFNCAASAFDLSDLSGPWSRFGVRCEGEARYVDLQSGNEVRLQISDNRFYSITIFGNDQTSTSGELRAILDRRGDRLDLEFSNVQHQDLVKDKSTIQDFLFFKIATEKLTLRPIQLNGESVLVLGDDTPKHMGAPCRTATEYLFRRIIPKS